MNMIERLWEALDNEKSITLTPDELSELLYDIQDIELGRQMDARMFELILHEKLGYPLSEVAN